MSDELKDRKIMPLNQTAHAEVLVRGNPVTTRPDATVENTFPGLEFDHRNLEKQFIVGLTIELHAGSGGWLRNFDRARGFPIAEADYLAGLMVWAVVGNIPDFQDPDTPRLAVRWAIGTPAGGASIGGSEIWQFIREFEPGPAAVVLGPQTDQVSLGRQNQIIQALVARQTVSIPVPGSAAITVISGDRADYLKDGVIDPNIYEAGDLTRSLCSPWQYDFTDCGCWYWASNKPDMVSVTPEGPQIYNFQRVRSGDIAPEPPTHAPVVSNGLWMGGHPAGTATPTTERVPRQMNHAELISNWEILPVVIDDHETNRLVKRPVGTLPDSELFPDRATIVDRLQYLASIEHALMIEYLYAYYSIDAPVQRPPLTETGLLRLYEAASTVLGVAIDEMRHFRWVNEILVLLGETPVLARAAQTEDKDGNGRYLPHEFRLTAATQAQIDWFIAVEQPSQKVDPEVKSDTIDGMYTRLFLSIRQSAEISDEIKDRVLHLIKLIIDEGYDHFQRFRRVRQLLPQPPDESHLRTVTDPAPLAEIHAAKALELRVDRSYEVILNLLLVVFGRGDREHGQLLEATRIAMVDSLDVECRLLIAAGGAPLFTLPRPAGDVGLGVFSAGPDPTGAQGMAIGRVETDLQSSLDDAVAHATAPLDALNANDLASDDPEIQARAIRSQAAMVRVRNGFRSVGDGVRR